MFPLALHMPRSSRTASSNRELCGQRDVDHVRKVRVGPRTHRDHDLTCGYVMGQSLAKLDATGSCRSGPWGFMRPGAGPRPLPAGLTAREAEVLALAASGLTTA